MYIFWENSYYMHFCKTARKGALSMQTASKLRPFGMRDKIGYAMGDLGCNLSFQLISSYMFLFYTQCIGLSTTNWAWIIVVSKIWDAVNDIIIGGMVDRHKLSQKSKFMPWIRIGAVGLVVFTILLFLPVQQFSQLGKVIWCLVIQGYIESRTALVYGPFNPLYGVGAVALTLALYRYRNRGPWLSFLSGMLVGSAVEYGCSFLQELILGSRSWDYSHLPFNLNGRICLLYSIFWGVLGVLWIKRLYPLMAKWILKIPNRVGKALTWVVFAFFVLDAAVTCLALARWIQRMDDIPPQNAFMQFVDERFTDERMEKIFPGMVFTGE